jgi:hypothetical protein
MPSANNIAGEVNILALSENDAEWNNLFPTLEQAE